MESPTFWTLPLTLEASGVTLGMGTITGMAGQSGQDIDVTAYSQALIGTRDVYFDGSFQETRIYDRDLLRPGDTFAGPAIVSEYSSATVLPFGDVLRVDGFGNLVIEVHG